MKKMNSYLQDVEDVGKLHLPWDKLTGKNVLITGATGLIGSCIVEVLLSRKDIDYQVYALGRNENRFNNLFYNYKKTGKLHFIKHDITKELDNEIRFDFIIHAASGANPREYATNPIGVMKSNILGTIYLLEYGIKHGIEKMLYISSGEVYGEGDGRIFTEEYSGYVNCASVRACYPSSKRASETLCMSYACQKGISVNIARPCHVYGPHFVESDNRVYAQFIRNVLQGEDIILKSTGEQFRSWCYVVDCVSAILTILLKGKPGDVYNIADESSNVSIRDLAEMIAGICSKKVVFQLPSDLEKSGYNVVKKSVYSTEKLRLLNWEVKTTLREGLVKTINYHLNRH